MKKQIWNFLLIGLLCFQLSSCEGGSGEIIDADKLTQGLDSINMDFEKTLSFFNKSQFSCDSLNSLIIKDNRYVESILISKGLFNSSQLINESNMLDKIEKEKLKNSIFITFSKALHQNKIKVVNEILIELIEIGKAISTKKNQNISWVWYSKKAYELFNTGQLTCAEKKLIYTIGAYLLILSEPMI